MIVVKAKTSMNEKWQSCQNPIVLGDWNDEADWSHLKKKIKPYLM